jgi:hypothetical protein
LYYVKFYRRLRPNHSKLNGAGARTRRFGLPFAEQLLRIGESRQRKKCTRFSKRCRALFGPTVENSRT